MEKYRSVVFALASLMLVLAVINVSACGKIRKIDLPDYINQC